MSEFCPQCGSARTGAFRFCRQCRFDFDGVAPSPVPIAQPVAKPSTKSRLTGRQWLGSGVALVVGLAVIGNLTNAATPVAGAQPTPAPTSRGVAAAATAAPTPWASVTAGLAPTGQLLDPVLHRLQGSEDGAAGMAVLEETAGRRRD